MVNQTSHFLPQNIKIIPGTHDRLLILPFPCSHSVRTWPVGHHPLLSFLIRKHAKYLHWDKMNRILYITPHIRQGH